MIVAIGSPFCNPLPFINPPHQFYKIGMLEEGTYDIRVRAVFSSILFFPFANDGTVIGTINNVQVAVPTPVPSLHWFSIGLLALLVLFVALFRFKKGSKRSLLLVVMLLFISNVQAEKIFHILLSADESAPTPAMVVAESSLSPPPPSPLLSAFTQFRPDRVEYIISQRPVGDLADFVNAHPQWIMSRLYRYLTIFYDDSIDESQVDAALSADPFIVGALFITSDLIPQLSTPATVAVKSHNKNTKSLNGTHNSYLNDLGIPSAWELSEGSGYIGTDKVGKLSLKSSLLKNYFLKFFCLSC